MTHISHSKCINLQNDSSFSYLRLRKPQNFVLKLCIVWWSKLISVQNYQYFTNKHTNVQHLQHDLHFHAKLNRSQTFVLITTHCWCSKVILSSKPHTKHNNLQTLHKCFFKLCRLNNFVLKLHIVGAAKTWNTHIFNICNWFVIFMLNSEITSGCFTKTTRVW